MNLDFLLNIVKMSYKDLNSFIVESLEDYYLPENIVYHNEDDKSFIYVKGSQPYMLVAHTDTVHKQTVKDIHVTTSLIDKNYKILSSPQGIGGDDRNGIAIIFALLEAGHRPSLLFPSGEEIGAKGSTRFTELHDSLPNVNLILQFDRRNNNDVTRYADDNDELIKEIVKLGYTEVHGSFSDISVICPKYLIGGVNVSASFFNEHTLTETTDVNGLMFTIKTFDKFLSTDIIHKSFIYNPKTYTTKGYQQTYLFEDTDIYKSYKDQPLLKTNSYVEDYGTLNCNVCGVYHPATNNHIIAETGGEQVVCDDCLLGTEHVITCTSCNAVQSFDSLDDLVFDVRQETLSCNCMNCLDYIELNHVLSDDHVDTLIKILMSMKLDIKKGNKI